MMMNCDKYYKKENDGSYNLRFLNTKGYSIEEIKEIFSVYGEVLAVNISGDQFGLRFVKYRTLDEIIRCFDGLRKSNFIKFVPEKSKSNLMRKRSKSNDSNQIAKKENPCSGIVDVNKQFISNLHDRSSCLVPMTEASTSNLETDQGNISDKAHICLNINAQDAMYNKYRMQLMISATNS